MASVRQLRPGELLVVGLAVALFTAVGELFLLILQTYVFVLDEPPRLSVRVVWMTPVAVTCVFALPALVLLLLSRVWQRIGSLDVAVTVFVFCGAVSGLLFERRLSLWAIGLLSLGVAVQAGWLAQRFHEPVMRIFRRGTAVLVACVVLAAGIVEVGSTVIERRAKAHLAAAPTGAPNVLFIILDTVRALSLSLYGYERQTTPNLERFARRGVVFDRAISPGTWTLTSHASMFTGRWPHELTAWWTYPRRPPFPTLAEVLRDRGYQTAAFIGNWDFAGSESGLHHGFIHYSDIVPSPSQIARGSSLVRWLASRRKYRLLIGMYDQLGRRSAPSVTDALLDWLEHDRERPFFAFVNYFDAHAPYLPPAPFDAAFGPSVTGREPIVIEELNRRTRVEPEVLQKEIDAYDGGIAYLDDHVGALLDEMGRRGLLENTVVIISSDHGEELGEHGHFGHASSFFREAIHVPLLLFGPGVPAGIRVQTPVTLRNIGATVTELAGFENANFPGTSLARFWRDPNAPGDTVLTEHEGLTSLYTDRYHFLQDPWDKSEGLFDIRLDPAEQRDLMGTPEAATVMPGILQTLSALAAKPESDDAVRAPVPVKN